MAEPLANAPPTLVLASTSRYRRDLLKRLDIAFVTAAPDFDERAQSHAFEPTRPEAFALRLAAGKAASLREAHADAWILAADQIAVLDGPPPTLLHKPETKAAAIDQLMTLAGRVHRLVTGVVLEGPAGERDHAVDVQAITMRKFPREEAKRYIDRYTPLDCVGSYRVEDAGIRLMAAIDGRDYTGIIGLPLLAVCRLLRQRRLLP